MHSRTPARLLIGLLLTGCSADQVVADGGEATGESGSTSETSSEPTTTTLDETTSTETGETGEPEFACGQCPTPWTHTGILEITPETWAAIPPCLTKIEAGGLRVRDIDDPEQLASILHLREVEDFVYVFDSMLPDLEPLRCLEQVGDGLSFSNLDAITDLHGLDALRSVGLLSVRGSAKLSSLAGLPTQLESPGSFYIDDNPSLIHLTGLGELAGFNRVSLSGNAGLVDLAGIEAMFDGVSARSLRVESNPALTSLAGLEGVIQIESLYLIDLPVLADFAPVAGLETVVNVLGLGGLVGHVDFAGFDALRGVGTLYVDDNPDLETLDGMPALEQVGRLLVSNNPKLVDWWGAMPAAASAEQIILRNDDMLTGVDELAGLAAFPGVLELRGCDNLGTLAALSDLQTIGALVIEDNAKLLSLAGLEQLSAATRIELHAQPLITELTPLASLSSLETLVLQATGVVDLAPLAQLSALEILSLAYNPSLSSLTGLEQVTSVGAYIEVQSNDALPDLGGLDGLTSIGSGGLAVIDNAAFTSLAGLEQLETVGGLLSLGTCTDAWDDAYATGTVGISSLAGLDALTAVGSLLIAGNPELVSLAGAPLLSEISGDLDIHDNPQLPPAAGLAWAQGLTVGGELRVCDTDDPDPMAACDWCTFGFMPQ